MAARGRDRESDPLIVAALAAGLTYDEAGRVAGKSGRTVRRRMQDPEFSNSVFEARDESLERLRRLVVDAAPAALRVLADITMTAESESARVAAARTILAAGLDQRRSKINSFDYPEVVRIVKGIIDEALKLLPNEAHDRFLRGAVAVMEPNL